jgi:hypothetical protein
MIVGHIGHIGHMFRDLSGMKKKRKKFLEKG